MKASIAVNASGMGTVALDGVDWSSTISGFHLVAHVGPPSDLVLFLPNTETDFEGEVKVHLIPSAVNLLHVLGWTPPPDVLPPSQPAVEHPASPAPRG